MAVNYGEGLRNAKLDAMTTEIGGGALLRIYDGTRPAAGAAITTEVLLAELTCNTPFAGAAAAAVLPVNPVSPELDATAGTASWWRLVKSDGTTWLMDGDIPGDMTLNVNPFVTGQTVEVATWNITAGNA